MILANLRRHEEAEAAFAEAEPYHGQHAHHWFARATNYLALKRYEEARAGFEKAVEFTKDRANVLAMARLAATLMALGRKVEARRVGQRVHHLTGTDPTEIWEQVLDAIWKKWPLDVGDRPRRGECDGSSTR